MSTNRLITVRVPHQPMDLRQVQSVIANLMKQVGHTGCFSGFDINFQQEIEFIANVAGEVKGVAALHE